jgi:hypothetical protein
VQLGEVKVSVASDEENAIVPPGVDEPVPAVSATVTPTVLDDPVVTDDGVSVTVTETERADTLIELLIADVKPLLDAVSVYPLPERLMLHPENDARPADAATGLVAHASAAPAVPVPLVIVNSTAAALPVAVLPNWSWTVTAACCANAAPADALALGGVLKASLFAAPALTLKAALVAPINPLSAADKVNPLPTLVGTRFEKVATPLTAATTVVEVPVSTPGLLMLIETLELSEVTVLPNWSSTFTATAGVIAAPA